LLELLVILQLKDLCTDDSPLPRLTENTPEDLEIMRVELNLASAMLEQLKATQPPNVYLDDDILYGKSPEETVHRLLLSEHSDNTSPPPPLQLASSSNVFLTLASDRHLSPRDDTPQETMDDFTNISYCPNLSAVQINISDHHLAHPCSYF
jgi:hypothetical protein